MISKLLKQNLMSRQINIKTLSEIDPFRANKEIKKYFELVIDRIKDDQSKYYHPYLHKDWYKYEGVIIEARSNLEAVYKFLMYLEKEESGTLFYDQLHIFDDDEIMNYKRLCRKITEHLFENEVLWIEELSRFIIL